MGVTLQVRRVAAFFTSVERSSCALSCFLRAMACIAARDALLTAGPSSLSWREETGFLLVPGGDPRMIFSTGGVPCWDVYKKKRE